MKARILMIGTSPKTRGGVSTVVNGYLSSILTENYCIKYISTHEDGNVLIKFLRAILGYGATVVSFIIFRPHLVHIHAASRASFYRKAPLVLLAWLFRIPIVYHHHGAEFMQFYHDECGTFRKKALRWVLGKPACIIALSESWKTNLLSIDKKLKVEVLSNAIPIPEGVPTQKLLPKKIILFMGRLGKRKGVYDLIEAARNLLEKKVDFQIILCGDGEIEPLKNECLTKELQDVVNFKGWIGGKEKERLLQQADIYALPSYNEGLPMSILEAISYGLPVVATPVGGIPEAVINNLNGYLIQPGDVNTLTERLHQLISENTLRLNMGKAARQLAEDKFDLSKVVKKLDLIYSNILKRHKRAQ